MNLSILKNCPLFDGIPSYSITPMMGCLRAREQFFGKNEFIYQHGDEINEIGIVLSGKIQIIKEDIWGNTAILAELGEGMLFGEAFVLGGLSKISLSVIACEKTNVLFLDKDRCITPCHAACGFHFDIVHNIIKILAEKNIFLTNRLEHLAKRSLKDKIMSYLSFEANNAGSSDFEVAMNRQQMADYLASDRSALSAALSKLQDEGIIEFSKNKFTLKI
ncbi:hypothetical protein IMSAG049_01735 [Clostridiales bacterium]|nr:hypothetical protein IMSAG049_01735 [Clostridiales bacterium]